MPSLSRRGFLGALAGAGAVPAVLPAARAEEGPSAVEVEVNGRVERFVPDDDERAVDVIRERLGLVATKEGCGQGACGACTVHLDEEPVCSCLLPASSLHGRRVRTLEAVDHPLQRAFAAEDALQCGYCTPGMLMAGIPFVDAWRAAQGDVEPPRAAIAAALAGNLCRCGAYDGIARAVAGACAGRFDGAPFTGERVEAEAKCRGQARYTVDLRRPGMLHAAVLRAEVARGVVRRVDLSRVEGVVLALVAPGSKIRFVGQELAAVAAADPRAARRALQAAVVEIVPEAPVIGLDAAPSGPPVWETPPGKGARWQGNVRGPRSGSVGLDAGGADRELGSAQVLVQTTVETRPQSHSPLEPHAVLAAWTEGGLEIWASTQGVASLAADVAERWGLRREQVKVHAEHVGGGFGCKAGADMSLRIAVDLAKAAGAPVRLVLDREEELLVGGYRPTHRIHLELAASAMGYLEGMRATAWTDSGVAVGSALGLLLRHHRPIEKMHIREYEVCTNVAAGRAFRAPGGTAAAFAWETAIDGLARKLGQDPISLRRRVDDDPVRERLYDEASRSALWARRGSGAAGRLRRGVGLAVASWPMFVQTSTQVRVRADADGFVVECATQDIGTGTRSVLARAVAEVLGLEPAAVRVRIGESEGPPGPTSAGSRVTASVWAPAQEAARRLASELARSLEGPLAGPFVAPGGVRHAQGFLPWAEALRLSPPLEVVARRDHDAAGYARFGGGWMGRRPPQSLVMAEVEVDGLLGRVRPLRLWSRCAVGRLAAPTLARSQVAGALIQNLSHALYEERVVDPGSGRLLTRALEDHRMAGLGDVPELELSFDEEGFEDYQGGLVGLAELAACPVLGALANAVADATGVYPTTLPMRADRLLRSLA